MKTIEERKARWLGLYEPGVDSKFVYVIGCSEPEEGIEVPGRPPLWPQFRDERIEWAWKRYEAAVSRAKWLDDDAVPFLSVTSGTEIFAEAFGARVHRPDDNMPFAIPFITSPEQAEKIKVPRLEDTPLTRLFDIADELTRRSGGEAPLQLPDMQSPMDVVAQLWDKTDLFPSMIEAPETVKELSEKIRTLQYAFLDEWFSRYGIDYIAHFPEYFMRGGITMSVDEIGSVSPEMYDIFFRDELNDMSRRYGGIGIHSCSDSRHQWGNLIKTEGLKMLNLYRPEPVLNESYRFFKDAAAMWPGNLVNNIGAALTRRPKKSYPRGCRIVLTEHAPTKEWAKRLAADMREEYGG